MADKRAPILDLDTLVERRTVRFEGAEYELLNPEEVSILDFHRISRQAQRISEMMSGGEMTEEQVKELSAALDTTCRFILKAPDEVHKKFTDLNKLAIIGVFSDLQMGKTAPATASQTEAVSQ